MNWQCGRFSLDLSTPKIMGILNMTPDSFSDGGDYSQNLDIALAHAREHLDNGADILDVGGESSRPKADHVSPEEEWARVEPILRELVSWQIPITLDTRRTAVMKRALDAGYIDAVNDISALGDEGAIALLAASPDIGICLMHMRGLPENMQDDPRYDDVCAEVRDFLRQRIAACVAAGIAENRLLLDPGIGFGKTCEHNLALLRDPRAWLPQDLPYLIGVSRKTFIGAILHESEPKNRLIGSVVAALDAVRRGAGIVRVHDVKATRQALTMHQALNP